MNKEAFLRQLEQLLSGISAEERADAMAFYRSYFEDAGEENEASVLRELGSPQKAAESILKNLGLEGNGSYYNSFANRDAEYYRNIHEAMKNMGMDDGRKKRSAGMTALIVTILVLTSPFWLTLLLLIGSVLLALVCMLFGIAVSVVAVVAALLITGVAISGVGVAGLCSGSPIAGFGLMGCGFIILALGILAILLMVWTFGVFLPWAFKWIARLCRALVKKGREVVHA